MEEREEQRAKIKFCVKLRKTATETFRLLKEAYGSKTLSRSQVFEWHKRFSAGRERVEDDARSGRPSTSHTRDNVERIKDILQANHHISVRMLADELNISKTVCHRILCEDLGKRNRVTRRHLPLEQKNVRSSISQCIDAGDDYFEADKHNLQVCFSNLPECLCVKWTEYPGRGYKVFSLSHIPALTTFGPYQGELIRRNKQDYKGGFVWQFEADNRSFCLNITDGVESNWLHYVNYAKSKEEQNLIVLQEGLEVYYIACKMIPANTELLVWYPVIISQEREASEINFLVGNMETDILQDGEISANENTKLLSGKRNSHGNMRSLHIDCSKFTKNAITGNVLEQEENRFISSKNRIVNCEENATPAQKFIGRTQECKGCVEQKENPKCSTQCKNKRDKIVWEHSLPEKELNECQLIREEILETCHFLKRLKHAIEHCVCKSEQDHIAAFCDCDYSSRKEYNCNISGQDNENSLEVIHIGSNQYECCACGKILSSRNVLEIQRFCSIKLAYACNLCKTTFLCMNRLKNHELTPTGKRSCKCDVCGKAFVDKRRLKNHGRIHTGEKPYECKMCGTKFCWKTSLNLHELKHLGESPYKCNLCKKMYTTNQRLKEHERTHTGEKPYKCNICKRAFSRNSYLKQHERTHTGERPYKCNICKKAFARNGCLKDHERTHTGEKPYECKMCGRRFRQRYFMVKHQRIHTTEQLFAAIPVE